MDKRFETRIIIDIHDWEVIVMAEAGYDYQDGRFFDWGRFNEEHGFTYEKMGVDWMDAERKIQEVLGWFEGSSNGSYNYIDRECFDPEIVNIEDKECTPEVNKLRKEIAEAAQRCFDKGIAPKEFMLDINW